MKLGVELVPYLQLERMVQIAQAVERLGYEQVWVADHYHNRSVYIALSQLSLSTSRIRLGPGVTNPYLTHPAVTAAAVATLHELSGGRALLGISAGDPFFLSTLGVHHHKPVKAVREAVQLMRSLWSGQVTTCEGEIFRCNGARLRFSPPGRIPVYIGGRRQKMLQLASEVADGALLNASHPFDIKECISHLNRVPEGFDTVAYLAVSAGRDVERANQMVRGIVAFVAASAPESSLEHHGIPPSEVEEVRKWLRVGEIPKAKEAVTPGMIEAFSVCGPLSTLENRIEEIRRLGITSIVIGSPIGPEPTAVLEFVSRFA